MTTADQAIHWRIKYEQERGARRRAVKRAAYYRYFYRMASDALFILDAKAAELKKFLLKSHGREAALSRACRQYREKLGLPTP